MISAAFVVGKETQKENGTDKKLTHEQTHAHTCPDTCFEHTQIYPGTHTGLCSDTESHLQMPAHTL